MRIYRIIEAYLRSQAQKYHFSGAIDSYDEMLGQKETARAFRRSGSPLPSKTHRNSISSGLRRFSFGGGGSNTGNSNPSDVDLKEDLQLQKLLTEWLYCAPESTELFCKAKQYEREENEQFVQTLDYMGL